MNCSSDLKMFYIFSLQPQTFNNLLKQISKEDTNLLFKYNNTGIKLFPLVSDTNIISKSLTDHAVLLSIVFSCYTYE